MLIAWILSFLLTKNPETHEDMQGITEEMDEAYRTKARKEAQIRTEVDNKAEAKYLSDYCKSKDETVIF